MEKRRWDYHNVSVKVYKGLDKFGKFGYLLTSHSHFQENKIFFTIITGIEMWG